MKLKSVVVKIELEDGRSAEAVFVRREKLREIERDRGDFGQFVRDLAMSVPPLKGEKVH